MFFCYSVLKKKLFCLKKEVTLSQYSKEEPPRNSRSSEVGGI